MSGFYCFTLQPVTPPLTVKERVALLSGTQKTGLLNYFTQRRTPYDAAHELKINYRLTVYIFDKINEMQETAKKYMRSEIVVTPEVSHIDPVTHQKVIDTPAVMNTPPTTQAGLATILNPLFDDFTTAQVTAIVSAMVKWSKWDGSGDFAFYASQIVL